MESIIADILLPNCKWRAGSSHAACRRQAMDCLQWIAKLQLLSSVHVKRVIEEDAFKHLVSCMDEGLYITLAKSHALQTMEN